MRGVDGELCYVGGEGGELNCGAAGACAQGEEGEVAYDSQINIRSYDL